MGEQQVDHCMGKRLVVLLYCQIRKTPQPCHQRQLKAVVLGEYPALPQDGLPSAGFPVLKHERLLK